VFLLEAKSSKGRKKIPFAPNRNQRRILNVKQKIKPHIGNIEKAGGDRVKHVSVVPNRNKKGVL